MQISYYHYSHLKILIVFMVNEHKNIYIAGLNRRAGYLILLEIANIIILKCFSGGDPPYIIIQAV